MLALPPILVAAMLSACGSGAGVNGIPNAGSETLTLSCAAAPSIAVQGTMVQVAASASSGQNAALTYSYSATNGTISGTGPNATLDTSLAAAGTVTVACRAHDFDGRSAMSTAEVTVVAVMNNAYYIATNGSDSGDGSAAHPFRTLTRAQTAMERSHVKTAMSPKRAITFGASLRGM